MRQAAILLAGLVTLVALPASAAQFRAYDVIVDTHGQPLAAYQIELAADDAGARIVGIEGGEHNAFNDAPYYDPAALKSGTVIIAAFSTETDLPMSETRVATLHMMEPDNCDCGYALDLTVAVDPDGNEIAADAQLIPAEGGDR